MKILLVGYGKMGRLVGSLAGEYSCEVIGIIDPVAAEHGGAPDDSRWRGADVAIDFSTPQSVAGNVAALARQGINLVVGTTGWAAEEPRIRQVVADAGIGIVVAPNFSTGVVLFEALVRQAARLFAPQA